MHRVIKYLSVLLLTAFVSVTAYTENPDFTESTSKQQPFLAAVVWVYDGDTIAARSNGLEYLIRLWGIDAPEKEQPGGKDATKYLISLTRKRTLKIIPVDTDIYGRLVAKVYSGNAYINLEMIKAGHAWWFKYLAPDEKSFESAQETSKSIKLGLWNNSAPIEPSIWRKNKNN